MMNKSNLIFTFAVLLSVTAACTGSLAMREGKMIKTELFFGMNIPNGGIVTQAEWAQFLSEEVTPRFSDGLTVFQAQGQWLGDDKIIAREESRVVVLLYPYSDARNQAILDLIKAYKIRFQQEAVMRVDGPVRLGFYK